MWVSIPVKILFAVLVWKWTFTSFTKNKLVTHLLLKILLLFIGSMMIEILLSWQFTEFTLSHMLSHPSTVIWLNSVIYMAIVTVLVAIFFTRQWLENERRQQELIRTKLATELAYLKAQIHPHFLFNTMNNIFSVAQRDQNDEIALAISRLAGLLRYNLYEGSNTFVPVEKEIAHLKDFIGLTFLRYTPEEVQVEFIVTGDTHKAVIAPMLLLAFIENAFKHGVVVEQKSVITISMNVTPNELRFECSNAKRHMFSKPMDQTSGIGLTNVRRRLALLYPNKHQLQIDDNEKSFVVNLRLQL